MYKHTIHTIPGPPTGISRIPYIRYKLVTEVFVVIHFVSYELLNKIPAQVICGSEWFQYK